MITLHLAYDVDFIYHTKQMRQSMIEQRIQNGETGCQTGVCAVQCLESLRAEISTARDLGWYKILCRGAAGSSCRRARLLPLAREKWLLFLYGRLDADRRMRYMVLQAA